MQGLLQGPSIFGSRNGRRHDRASNPSGHGAAGKRVTRPPAKRGIVVKSGPRIYNLFPALIGPIDRWSSTSPGSRRCASIGLRQPVPRARVLRQLVRHQRLLPLNPFFRAAHATATTNCSEGSSTRARGRYRGDDGSRHQSHRQGRCARHRPPAVVRARSRGAVSSPFAVDPADASKRTVWHDLAELDWSERPEREALVTFSATSSRTT